MDGCEQRGTDNRIRPVVAGNRLIEVVQSFGTALVEKIVAAYWEFDLGVI